MNYRKMVLPGVVLAIVLWAAPGALAMDLRVETLLEKVQKVYAGAIGFRAEYALTFKGGAVAATGVSSGTKKTSGVMLYGRPDKLRLIQNSPMEEEMVIAPTGIWWYLREDNEAHRYPASDFYALFAPIMGFFKVLGDFKALEDAFKVTRHVGQDKGKEKAIKMVPLSHRSGLDRLVIWVGPGGGIIQVAVHILNGDSSTYRFKTMEVLSEEPVEGFGFTPPAGARIVHH